MGIGTAILASGAISAGAGVASGIMGSNAAQSAAQTQATAAEQATQAQLQMFGTVQQNLMPFITAGQGALNAYTGALPALTAPFTGANLAQTPGYQFTLNQGLQATQNAYAAQGLGSSGAAVKGATNYAEGLAGTTYQQQFQNYLAQNQQIANLLYQPVALGETAAAQTGALGVQSQSAANQYLTGAAAASAAGTVGSTNAITNSLSNLTGTAGNTALLLALNNNGIFSNPATPGSGYPGVGPGVGTGGLY